LLVPHVPWPDLRRIAGLALAGALLAGGYGILHDQLTFTLAPEYFTRLKFAQFHWADCGLPPRTLVAWIGFLATWWVGFFATWFFARIAAPRLDRPALSGACLRLWGQLAGTALACGSLGYLLGPHYYLQSPDWRESLIATQLAAPQAFARVAGIHLGGYLGALGAWLWAMFQIIRKPLRPTC
jgi:hypothetical protein